MQHDLFPNLNRQQRVAYPLLVTPQARVAGGQQRVVAPLITISASVPQMRLLPMVEHGGARYAVMIALMSHMLRRILVAPVGSVAAWCDEITRAWDWLFSGI